MTTWTSISKPTISGITSVLNYGGEPIGLLLSLTIPQTSVVSGGVIWTTVSKPSGTAWTSISKAT